jgi:hypothetical protein
MSKITINCWIIRGQAAFTRTGLALYDLLVLRGLCPWVWRCPNKRILAGKLKYPDYDEAVTLVPDESSTFTSVGNVAAKMGLENDGRKDWIVEVQYSSSHGMGCDESYPGILRPDKKGLDTARTGPLAKLLPSCGSEAKPFSFDGYTYIEVVPPISAHPTEHKVVKMDRGTPTDMCTISTHSTYAISSP